MINLNNLYTLTEKENIKVKKEKFKEFEANGLCLYNTRKCNIYLNKNIETETEEKCVLAEEIGHYKTGIDFNLLSTDEKYNEITRSINEFRAKKWAVNELIPFSTFKSFLGTNKSKLDIANELEVTEELVELACNIYEPILYENKII